MKTNSINNNQAFLGKVYYRPKKMTALDNLQLEQNAERIIEFAKDKAHDFTIFKNTPSTMSVKASLKNHSLTRDVYGYSVDKREKNIDNIIETMQHLINNFKG